MSTPISGITGIVNHNASVPTSPHNTEFEYTSQLIDDVYTVTFRVPFNSTPCVLVTVHVTTAGDAAFPLATPIVSDISANSFSVRFCTYVPAADGNLNLFTLIETGFSFAALEVTTRKQG